MLQNLKEFLENSTGGDGKRGIYGACGLNTTKVV